MDELAGRGGGIGRVFVRRWRLKGRAVDEVRVS